MSESEGKSEKLRLEGNELFKQENYELAIEKYTEALKLSPECYKSLANRCQCYCLLKNGIKAVEDGKNLTNLKNDWAKGWYRLGFAYQIADDLKNAADAYLKAYETDNTLHEAKQRYNLMNFALKLPKSVQDAIKNNEYQNFPQIASTLNPEDLQQVIEATNQQNTMEHFAHVKNHPQESMEKISKLASTDEFWFISWSTTPDKTKDNQRYYQMIIAESQSSMRVGFLICQGEPTATDVIQALQSAMLKPLDFGRARKPQMIGFAYRMKHVFDQVNQFLSKVNVDSRLEPLQQAIQMAKETGNHYLGLNHLIYESDESNNQ